MTVNHGVLGSIPSESAKNAYIGRISTVERELGFLEVATNEVIMPQVVM